MVLTFFSKGVIINHTNILGGSLWNISRLLKLAIFAKVQRTVVAANVRHPASPLAKQAAVSLTSSVRTNKVITKREMPPIGGIFSIGDKK